MEREEGTESTEPASILVVEDDEDTADFLRALLADAGHTVVTAGDGAEGLRLLQSNTPDLVLLDVMLPQVDGYTVAQRIRGGVGGTLPIIMLTAAGEASSKLRGFDAGVDDFVVKPFAGPELLARVSVQVRRSRAMRSLEDQSSFLQQALELMSRRHEETTTTVEMERSMRTELLRSVNTHLQSLCAVLDTEFRRQPPGAGREALLRVIPRVRGAALVYQIAQELTGEVADFAALLRTIASSLKSVYSPRKRIPVSVDAPTLEISSVIASPLSMVATELITNAFKHAFPHSRFGAITIVCRAEDGTVRLDVIDDGVGLSQQETPSRGLSIVRQLITDLGGTFDVTTGPNGTRAAVQVPLPAQPPGAAVPG